MTPRRRRKAPRARRPRPAGTLSHASKREMIRAAKDVPCTRCGGSFPPECMDFDHVRGRKRFTISAPGYRTLQELTEEMAKCDVLCACCHRIVTTERRRSKRKGGRRGA